MPRALEHQLRTSPRVNGGSSKERKVMKTAVIAISLFLLLATCLAESPSAKWQVATIMEVKAHPQTDGVEPSTPQYDVTVRVGTVEYVVLYVPPDGTQTIRYLLGIDHLVLVGDSTIKYNDLLGASREVPILRSRRIQPVTAASKPEVKR